MDIIIVGAGGYGIEAYDLIYHINKRNEGKYRVLGFVDDTKDSMDSYGIDRPILSTIVGCMPNDSIRYVLGIADPKSKEKIANMLKERGALFETLISPTAVLDEGLAIGEGCVIKDLSVVSRGASIGNFVSVCGCVGGGARIGDYCTMGAYCNVTNALIGKRVFVGSHSTILSGKKVGDDVIIGAGSVVITNIRPGRTVFGNPAKSI